MLSTVSVTLERFFAIVFPLRDVTCIKRWLIPASTTFTVVYNFPKFFEISCLRDPETMEFFKSIPTHMVGSLCYSSMSRRAEFYSLRLFDSNVNSFINLS